MRKALIVVVALAVIGAVLYFFHQFKEAHSPVSDSMHAIPVDAALIIEVENPQARWDNLRQSNLMWQQVQQLSTFKSIDFTGQMLDSLVARSEELQKLFHHSALYISAHPNGASGYGFLYSMALPKQYQGSRIVDALKKNLRTPLKSDTQKYNGKTLNTLTAHGKSVSIAFPNNILVMSTSSLLVEDAIKQVASDYSLAGNSDLKELERTTSVKAHAHLYVNLRKFPSMLKGKLSGNAKKIGFFKSPLASWAAYDIHLSSNSLSMNGFASAPDSAAMFLDAFKGQSPQKLSLDRYMPANTAYYVWYGWSNLERMRKNYRDFLERENRLYHHSQSIEALSQKCNCSTEDLLLSWLGNEAAVAVTEPTSPEYDQNRFLLFEYANREMAQRKLGKLGQTLDGSASSQKESTMYRGHRIGHLHGQNMYARLLNDAFCGMKNACYTFLDGAVILANSENALRVFINTYNAENTLTHNLAYTNYRSNLSEKSNITLYSSLSRSPFIYQHLLKGELARELEKQTDLLREFEATSFQFSFHRNNLFYSSIFLKYNPVYKRQTTSMWELALKGPMRNKPTLVTNHYTGAGEIFLQDENYLTYLVSNTGEVLWKRQLEGPVMGGVTQIDAYRNNKLQMLFNTPNRVYLLDRNGKDVAEYPRSLKSSATAPLAVFDYDNSRHYRIVVPTANRKLVMFNGQGKTIEGWKPTPASTTISHPAQHIRVGDRDYIFALDDAGKVYLLNRRGEVRHRVSTRARGANRDELVIQKGSDIASCRLYYGDTLGNAHFMKFDGTADNLITTGAGKGARFTIRNIAGGTNKEFVVSDSLTLMVFNTDGSKLLDKSFETPILGAPQVFRFQDKSNIVGLTFSESRTIRLMNPSGKQKGDMPLYGATHFAIDDINQDGTLNLVAGSRDGYLYAYSLW